MRCWPKPMRTPKTAPHQYLLQTLHNDTSLLYYIKVLCPKHRTISLLRRHTISTEFMLPLSIFSTSIQQQYPWSSAWRPPIVTRSVCYVLFSKTFHTESFPLYSQFVCPNRSRYMSSLLLHTTYGAEFARSIHLTSANCCLIE